jgi:RNA polymerase sigma factor (sigma-70 family)
MVEQKEILQAFLEGDDRAFTAIYYQYAELLLSYGSKFNIRYELTCDALQEVFTDLYLKRRKKDVKIDNLKGYLFIAMKNNLLKKIAKEKKSNLLDLSGNKEIKDFTVEYSFQDKWVESEISKEIKQKLGDAIQKLSSKQKEIIFLKFEEELDYRAIAAILNISIESARKQLYRALKSLREAVDQESFRCLLFFFLKKNIQNCPYFSKQETLIV